MPKDETSTDGTCPNCGSPVSGHYCPECGQRQGDELVPSVRKWLGEALDDLLLVEARFPRTLRALIWPPGELTAEWWRGRRASYMSPMRLYLLAAIPFFFAVSTRSARQQYVGATILEIAVVGGYIQSHEADFLPSGRAELMPPLPAEQRGDSLARAEWQAERQRRRTEAAEGRREQDEQLRAGMGRVFDVLPVAVGVIMVPFLALLLRLEDRKQTRFAAHLVFSLHAHTVAYACAALGWPLGLSLWTGGVGGGAYLGFTRHRILGERIPTAVGVGLVFPMIYSVVFLATYVALVLGLSAVAPAWLFGV